MDKNSQKRRALISTILKRREDKNSVSNTEFAELTAELKNDPELMDFYVNFMIQHSGLIQSGIENDLNNLKGNIQDSGSVDYSLLTQLSLEEHNAPTLDSHDSETIIFTDHLTKSQILKRYYPLVGMFAILISCFVAAVSWIDRHDNKSIAAQVVDSYQVEWESGSYKLKNNDLIYDNNRQFQLKKGTLKILFEEGARVVLDGPATFSIKESDRMSIQGGKIFVHVPNKSVGFRVDTPSCDVVDLGTEFGINVNPAGESDVYLYKGKAMLVPAVKHEDNYSQLITKNEACHISNIGEIVEKPFSNNKFIRDFDSKRNIVWKGEALSLADIVTGGDGFGTPKENLGIDQVTGKLVTGNTEVREQYVISDYIKMSNSKFIDGIFVPDSEHGPMQITSAGSTYDGFDDTTGNYFMPIGVYSYVTLNYSLVEGHETKSIHLNGYPEGEAVNLCMHANAGITFDLSTIRKNISFAKIKGFSSVIGIPITYDEQTDVDVDFYVFVDGKPVIEKKRILNTDEPETINIPLSSDAKFLTLVCAEGSRNYGDWSVFVNPVLELELPEYE